MAGGEKDVYEITEMSESRAVIRAWKCPVGIDNHKICIAHTHMEKAVVEGLNHNLTLRVSKSLAAGDPYCEYTIDVTKQG
jgi:hypothetical protein